MIELLLLLAGPAFADLTPTTDKDPSAPPAVATAAATAAAAKAPAAVRPKPSRPLRATVHAEAADWEPVSLEVAGDPGKAETKVEVRLAKVKGKYKGTVSKAKASARLHKAGADRWLVISVFPSKLDGLIGRRRPHFEIRLKITEGFVEEAKASLVALADARDEAGTGLDSWELRERGIAYEESFPGAGRIRVSALDPRPSKDAFNAGKLHRAAFVDRDVRLADVSWSARGLR